MKLKIKNITLPVEVMDTPDKRTLGMMGRTSLDGAMLFKFDSVYEHGFWMKNCKIPLDIVYLTKGIVNRVYKNVPPCEDTVDCKLYYGIGDSVVELMGGTVEDLNVKIGDLFKFID